MDLCKRLGMDVRKEILALRAILKVLEEKEIELFKQKRDVIIDKLIMYQLDFNRKKVFINVFYSEH
jgi:hypothetical protein